MTRTNTLHCMSDVINWTETYAGSSMKPYPLEPIMAIGGYMAVGKTKALLEFLGKGQCTNKDTKCLIITFSRILSYKYENMFKALGFINYLEKDSIGESYKILDNKVIVCLDSLPRIVTRNFDFIIIDEVMSVLMHFNSPHLDHDIVSTLFELLLLQARHVMFLDAHIDNLLVYNFIDYLCAKRNKECTWIRNTYIRPTNKHALVTISNSKKHDINLKFDIAQKVISILMQGKKVVVSSSTKSFTQFLENEIKSKFGDDKTMYVYNSDTEANVRKSHCMDPDNIWIECDVLIYSPAITAGVSFEIEHFHSLVAYIENSRMTPPLDIVLQQLFRIRLLIDGDMNIYLNDSTKVQDEGTDHPTTMHDVEEWLDAHAQDMQRFFPPKSVNVTSALSIQDGYIKYDKDKLSYHILCGIIYNMNRSISYFTNTLINTLKTDYKIPVEVVNYSGDINEEDLEKALMMQERWKTHKKGLIIPFGTKLLNVTDSEYEEFEKKERRSETLNDEDKQKMWCYQVINLIWRIEKNKVDQPFYDSYINQCTPEGRAKTYTLYYKAKRFMDLMDNTLEMNKATFNHKMDYLVKSKTDHNMDLYHTNMKKYYGMLIEGQTLLDQLFDGSHYKTELWNNGCLQVETIHLYDKVGKYLKNCIKTKECFSKLLHTFDMHKNQSYKDFELMIENKKQLSNFTKKLLENAFEITLTDAENNTKNMKSKKYEKNSKIIGCTTWKHFKETYKSPVLTRKIEKSFQSYCIDDEDPIDGLS